MGDGPSCLTDRHTRIISKGFKALGIRRRMFCIWSMWVSDFLLIYASFLGQIVIGLIGKQYHRLQCNLGKHFHFSLS